MARNLALPRRIATRVGACLLLPVCATIGCALKPAPQPVDIAAPAVASEHAVRQVAHQAPVDPPPPGSASRPQVVEPIEVGRLEPPATLPDLIQVAVQNNPTLTRLNLEATAADQRVGYVGALPDPKVGANIFAYPIETAAGSQRANFTMMQTFPWWQRLEAQTQKAYVEAMLRYHAYEAEKLRVVGRVRATWYRLYVVEKQIETTRALQKLLTTLIERANAAVSTGKGSPSDVRLGTVEYGQLEERMLSLRQQRVATVAALNRLCGRASDHPIASPEQLPTELPRWTHDGLVQLAQANQPEIQAAFLRTQATEWGIVIARLEQRPDVTLSASWFAIDDNRPAAGIVDVGRDAWSVGALVSIPLRHRKYEAKQFEAVWKNHAANASVEEVMVDYNAMLLDLWHQAQASHDTARLYRATILPEAKRTLEADQASYTNGNVEFDRVVRDFRNVLTLELGYHRAIGQLATALARIQVATATDLDLPSGGMR